MKQIKEYIILTAIVVLVYFLVIVPFQTWNCRRIGMGFDPFIYGCVIKEGIK